LWDCDRGNQTDNGPANGDFIGNNEMLEVDKGGDNECKKTHKRLRSAMKKPSRDEEEES
jgi:hypothetical protein